jgi:cell wall-associated NlpC family hydrolase
MRRFTLFACVLALLTVAGTAGAQPSAPKSWATQQIQAVVDAGLMAPTASTFRPQDTLTVGDLAPVLATFGLEVSVVKPSRPVTLRELDAQLVTAAGLREQARTIQLTAYTAGLKPKKWLGTETVARLLGLRLNHTKDREHLELQLDQPATRAEAAYSIARLLSLGETELEQVRATADSFYLPALTPLQKALLARAARFVGSPYVWAGTSEKPQTLAGRKQPGGFDCSGFVWRVFKLQPTAGAPGLATALKGRTTYEMSGEFPKRARVTWAALQPADVVFFGVRGPRSKPNDVGHMGIYLGNGWMAHSSDRGTTLTPMTGWYESRFAWGRNVLVESSRAGGAV